jgi:hypothetical protein
MFWPDLEVGRNQYDWTQIAKYDAQVNALVAHHFSVIVVWEGIPRWAMTTPLKDYKCSKDSTMGPPASPVYFQEFAATIAQRYGDRVAAYELWNEPDGNCKWPGKGSQFRDLIAVPGFDGIRSQQPNAVVLTRHRRRRCRTERSPDHLGQLPDLHAQLAHVSCSSV